MFTSNDHTPDDDRAALNSLYSEYIDDSVSAGFSDNFYPLVELLTQEPPGWQAHLMDAISWVGSRNGAMHAAGMVLVREVIRDAPERQLRWLDEQLQIEFAKEDSFDHPYRKSDIGQLLSETKRDLPDRLELWEIQMSGRDDGVCSTAIRDLAVHISCLGKEQKLEQLQLLHRFLPQLYILIDQLPENGRLLSRTSCIATITGWHRTFGLDAMVDVDAMQQAAPDVGTDDFMRGAVKALLFSGSQLNYDFQALLAKKLMSTLNLNLIVFNTVLNCDPSIVKPLFNEYREIASSASTAHRDVASILLANILPIFEVEGLGATIEYTNSGGDTELAQGIRFIDQFSQSLQRTPEMGWIPKTPGAVREILLGSEISVILERASTGGESILVAKIRADLANI